MEGSAHGLTTEIATAIRHLVSTAETQTEYWSPLIAFAAADDPRFAELRRVVHPAHMLPGDLLPGARSVVSFFLPFAPWVVEANARHRTQVAREWALAYVETNALIGQITASLIAMLAERGVRAAAEPATHNFDPVTLVSRWSHKSVAVIAGLGSFGLHYMVITDAGCAGRFGSLVVDAELSPASDVGAQASGRPKERCLYFHDESCLECVARCPVSALDPADPINKQSCWERCQEVAEEFKSLGRCEACGKCAIGPCSFESAV